MIYRYNEFGDDEATIMDDDSALRIGKRIKQIRSAKGLSQKDLGELIGVSNEHISKYERGIRKPKLETISQIAEALNVHPFAILDPTTSSYINTMYVFFELEEKYGLVLTKEEHKYIFSFEYDKNMNKYIKDWYLEKEAYNDAVKKAATNAEKEQLLLKYNEWKWSYPISVANKGLINNKKQKIKDKIDELQKQINVLQDELNFLDEK